MGRSDVPADAPIDRITDWPSFFEEIRQRPGMWLVPPSPASLRNLLFGMDMAVYLYDVPEEKCLQGFNVDAFECWFQASFNPQQLPLNSFSMARRGAEDDAAGLRQWFVWYDAYRREQAAERAS